MGRALLYRYRRVYTGARTRITRFWDYNDTGMGDCNMSRTKRVGVELPFFPLLLLA